MNLSEACKACTNYWWRCLRISPLMYMGLLLANWPWVDSSYPSFSFNSTWTMNFQMFKLDLEKAKEPEIKLPTSTGSWKKQESSRKTSTSALLTMPTTNYGRFLEMGISDHLTCLLRNLYAGQEATVRTGHGTTDWFQIGKGVRQGCILSPCLFNLYAEYIMRNAGLHEAQLNQDCQEKYQ